MTNPLNKHDSNDAGQRPSPLQQLRQTLTCAQSESLTVAQAQQVIHRYINPLTETEQVSLHQALGRVLATDVISAINVPPHDNSAMDGYALRGSDLLTDLLPDLLPNLPPNQITQLRVCGSALAGRAYAGTVAAGECVRIMTGAVMPADCDTVIPIELVSTDAEGANGNDNNADYISFTANGVRAGDNRRRAGEDIAKGSVALQQGTLVRPADLGLLASLGMASVTVIRRLRVAFFSTGDELTSAGMEAAQGELYDSNRYTLYGMLTRLGCEVIDMGIIKDDPHALQQAFIDASKQADAIITSGGVSVGDADYTRDMMAQLGDVEFWQIAMRPGRPLAFGSIATDANADPNANPRADKRPAIWFGLPGNPVAVMVSFYFFAQNALQQLMGAQTKPPLLVAARAVATLRKRAGRTEYQRGIAHIAADGQLHVALTGAQGSGMLRSMSEANCMIVLSHEQSDVAAGQQVQVLLFEGLV